MRRTAPPISRRWLRAYQSLSLRVTRVLPVAITARRNRHTASPSTRSLRLPTTLRSVVPTSAIRMPVPTATTGTRQYLDLRLGKVLYSGDPLEQLMRKPASCKLRRVLALPTDQTDFATAISARFSEHGCRRWRTERLRDRGAVQQWRREWVLPGIPAAFVAVGSHRGPKQRCAQHSGRFAVRCRQSVGTLLRLLLVGHGQWRGPVRRRSQQLGRRGWDVLLGAHHGRDPGSGKPEDREPPR